MVAADGAVAFLERMAVNSAIATLVPADGRDQGEWPRIGVVPVCDRADSQYTRGVFEAVIHRETIKTEFSAQLSESDCHLSWLKWSSV
jgi:hypothetical protein